MQNRDVRHSHKFIYSVHSVFRTRFNSAILSEQLRSIYVWVGVLLMMFWHCCSCCWFVNVCNFKFVCMLLFCCCSFLKLLILKLSLCVVFFWGGGDCCCCYFMFWGGGGRGGANVFLIPMGQHLCSGEFGLPKRQLLFLKSKLIKTMFNNVVSLSVSELFKVK